MAGKGMDRFTHETTTVGDRPDSFLAQSCPVDEQRRQFIDMRILELLISKLCHELSGPIAAINNGVELLTDEDWGITSAPDPGFMRNAVTLVDGSARRARSRLQFYRFAYSFNLGSAIMGPAPHEIAVGFFAESRIATDYAESVRALSPALQKLACNMLSVAAASLPRGGRLVVTDAPLTVEAYGEAAALSVETRKALVLATPIAALTTRTVQPYFTGLLAKALTRLLDARAEPGRVRLTAAAPPP
jgi:histidine phosphotransferase ChpT